MALRRIIFAFAVAAGCAAAAAAQNSTFTPSWVVGDQWSVEYSVQQMASRPDPAPASTLAITYRYTVLPQTSVTAQPSIQIKAVPDKSFFSTWTLSFDLFTGSLLSATEQTASGMVVTENPFGKDSWFPSLGEFGSFIMDYPRLPPNNQNVTRTIAGSETSTPGFMQSDTFSPSRLTSVMTRPDPVSGMPHSTTIEWKPNAKWWQTARITIGNQVEISAKLK